MANGKDNNGTKYRLADTYEELYTAGVSDWTGESVFDIQMAISGTQTNTNAPNGAPHIGFGGALGTGGWGFYQPSYDLVILTSLTQMVCLKWMALIRRMCH